MEPLEAQTHSFIVKVWRERLSPGVRRFGWRGHITHVPSGERQYIQSLDDIAEFIAPYLQRMDAQLELFWRLRHLLRCGIRQLRHRRR